MNRRRFLVATLAAPLIPMMPGAVAAKHPLALDLAGAVVDGFFGPAGARIGWVVGPAVGPYLFSRHTP